VEISESGLTLFPSPFSGDKDEAFRWLEKGYQDRSVCMQFTKVDPRLTPLHGDPRYEDLLRRLAFP
jgi:hypothetical protein